VFDNYLTGKDDFQAIEEGLAVVEQKELDFIFKNRSLLKDVVVISYDSANLYLWTKIKFSELETVQCNVEKYYAYKISHNTKLKDEWQTGWRAGLSIRPFVKLLPANLQKSKFKTPKISGGLLKPFIELQKKKKRKNNPYINRESYLATIVHEFGHIYWNQHKLWFYSDKKENIRFTKTAEKLYNKENKTTKAPIFFPAFAGITELYAFCAEYWTSEYLWPNHKKNLDAYIKERLGKLRVIEEEKDLEREDSVLAARKHAHNFAFVFGKILLTRFPKTWPQLLTARPSITSHLGRRA
jgi:hypothetical protein